MSCSCEKAGYTVKKPFTFWTFGAMALLLVVLLAGSVYTYRAVRLWRVSGDMRDQIRYLIENGGTIGEVPASDALSTDYLKVIFGQDPAVLSQLERIVQQGLTEDPVLNLGEVSALIVTYHKSEDGDVRDVVAHVVGGFPLDTRRPGFHRDGYFRHLLDRELWDWSNSALGFLGRDMVLFAEVEVADKHQEILEALLSGNILPFVDNLDDPMYYTAVFPNPRRILPGQLRHHVESLIVKGHLAKYDGSLQAMLLTDSARASRYTLAVLNDIKMAAEVALKTKWKGVVRQTDWGPMVDPWWSYELVQTSEGSTLERENGLVRISTDFERVMVNVTLKVLERLGRDMAQMRGIMTERKDPRVVDAEMQTRKPAHYWSEEHRWGPNWPIAPRDTNVIETAQQSM
jgi:hypothetical protein